MYSVVVQPSDNIKFGCLKIQRFCCVACCLFVGKIFQWQFVTVVGVKLRNNFTKAVKNIVLPIIINSLINYSIQYFIILQDNID